MTIHDNGGSNLTSRTTSLDPLLEDFLAFPADPAEALLTAAAAEEPAAPASCVTIDRRQTDQRAEEFFPEEMVRPHRLGTWAGDSVWAADPSAACYVIVISYRGTACNICVCSMPPVAVVSHKREDT